MRWTPSLCIAFFSSLLVFFVSTSNAQSCSATKKCPSSSPCCSVSGTCGSGAISCSNGCQPMASYTAGSCLPNPICTNKNITFQPSDYKNANMFRPVLLYNGNATHAPFTLDYGYLGAGPEGVLLELTAPVQTKISSTDYVLYGNIQLTARHTARQGLVFTFITMSDIKDEIDNEQTTADGSNILTNFFNQGITVPGSSATIPGGNGFDVSDWHTYGINWQPKQLQWLIDGNVVHTVLASSVGNGYPRSPSQVQISVWAGGNSTNPQGVIDWSGGPIDWTNTAYTKVGYYSAEIKSYSITCGSQSVNGVSTTGNGTIATSWVYTGQTSSNLNEPEFILSSNPIKTLSNPSSGGTPGLPGYISQSVFTKSNSNAWDGSGSTSGLSNSEITGNGSNSGGWLAGNKTLSIAVPVIAVLLAIITLIALVSYCKRRRRRRAEDAIGYSNTKSAVDSQFSLGNRASLGGTAQRQSSYSKLDGDDEYEQDMVPYGAQKVGTGYGPAVGPTPENMNRIQQRSDGGYEAYPMGARQQQGYSQNTHSGYSNSGGYMEPAYTSSPNSNNKNYNHQQSVLQGNYNNHQYGYSQQQQEVGYPYALQSRGQQQSSAPSHQMQYNQQYSQYSNQQSGPYRNY